MLQRIVICAALLISSAAALAGRERLEYTAVEVNQAVGYMQDLVNGSGHPSKIGFPNVQLAAYTDVMEWVTIDVSDYVGQAASQLMLFVISPSHTNPIIYTRTTDGETVNWIGGVSTLYAQSGYLWVPTDSSGRFQVQAGQISLNIYLIAFIQ